MYLCVKFNFFVMIQSHYVPLERPFRIIYAEGAVGLQIGTLIVVDNQTFERSSRLGNITPSYIGFLGIKTYSYPVVSYINKVKENVSIPDSDIGYGGGAWSEGEVWQTNQKDVSTLCLEGGNVKWESLLEILTTKLRQCQTYDDHVEELINIMNIVRTVKELGGNLTGPNLETVSYMEKPNGEIRVIVPLTCNRESDGTLLFQTAETDPMMEKPFHFFAHVSDLEEAAKIIKRQENFYRHFNMKGEPCKRFSIVYDDDRKQPEDGRSELIQLIELLKKMRD